MHPFDRKPPPDADAPRYCIVVEDELGVAYARTFPGMKLTPAVERRRSSARSSTRRSFTASSTASARSASSC